MAPRNRNLIPDMKETRWKTQTFSNPYSPQGYRTPAMSRTAMPKNDGFDLGGFLKWGFGGPISQEQQAINQAKEDANTVNVFGRDVKVADITNLAATAALTAAGIYAARNTMKAAASTRSLAASRVANAATIAANREAARVQFRDMVEARRVARRNRRGTTVRALRMERVEAALRDRDYGLAQSFGDRAYALRAGTDIGTLMARSDTVGKGRRTAPSIGFGPRQQGASSFPYTDSHVAGSHHQYTPVSRAVPTTMDANKWLNEFGPFADPYGRTGMDRLVGMYPGGVPRGGWMRQPNTRTRTPLPPRYGADGKPIINIGEMADGPLRDQVAGLLDDAVSFRNRSAWRLQDGRTPFPRPYGWIYEPSWAPESYQLRVLKAAGEKARLSAPKKRIGKGK
jgi:hypothetical protein